MVSIKAHKDSKMGFFAAFGDFIGLSVSIWEKHFLRLISTFCYILFMFEKQTNTFVCKAAKKEKVQEARETGSWNKSPEFRELSNLDQNLFPSIHYPNFCYLQTSNWRKYEEILTIALIKTFLSSHLSCCLIQINCNFEAKNNIFLSVWKLNKPGNNGNILPPVLNKLLRNNVTLKPEHSQ